MIARNELAHTPDEVIEQHVKKLIEKIILLNILSMITEACFAIIKELLEK